MSFLEIHSLTHVFSSGNKGIDRLSLKIERGSFVVLAGPNGSGKTVLMRHLNGLAKPSAGKILLEGKEISSNLSETRRRIGLVFQDPDAQIVGQTVARDIAFGPENLRLPREEITARVHNILAITGLTDLKDRRPHSLSGGEKRRLALAGVLAMEPDLLVLDEPFTGLDWLGSTDLLTVLQYLHAEGKTLLLITHDLDKVLAHADRLILMEKGRIVGDDFPHNLLDIVEKHGVRKPLGHLKEMSWQKK